MDVNDGALLELAARLAKAAGARIMAVRAAGFQVHRKADRSVVTEADGAAEEVIVAGLREAGDVPVVAEEEIAAGRVAARTDCCWLVDPLDGTREFAAGRDEFAVNIGLVRGGAPVLGVVYGPATGMLYGGIVGRTAWREDATGRREPIRTRATPGEGACLMVSRHGKDDPELTAYLAERPVATTEWLGSSLKFCRIAEGTADRYVRFGRTMEWDTAAPQAVVEAAGGAVLDLRRGGALGYGKAGWENPAFVCVGRDAADPVS